MRDGQEVVLVVREKQEGKQGRWVCLSCGEALEHNLGKDLHCDRERALDRKLKQELGDAGVAHVLGWWNFSTGDVEVP